MYTILVRLTWLFVTRYVKKMHINFMYMQQTNFVKPELDDQVENDEGVSSENANPLLIISLT